MENKTIVLDGTLDGDVLILDGGSAHVEGETLVIDGNKKEAD